MEKWDAYDSDFKKIDGKILIRGEEKDIPDGVVACGNPCKVIREIDLEDKEIWEKRKKNFLIENF